MKKINILSKEQTLHDLVMVYNTNDFLCDLYNDLAQEVLECGDYEDIPTIEELLIGRIVDEGFNMGYHYSYGDVKKVLKQYTPDVVITDVNAYLEDDDDLPF
jgi:hypothetical protein